jgi:addiction module HigA family antidote
MAKKMKPLHPGEMLREEFMKPLGLTMNKLALDLRVPVTPIGDIVHERRGITADTALRLARYFNNTPEFWMNLQSWYDLPPRQRQKRALSGPRRGSQGGNISQNQSQRQPDRVSHDLSCGIGLLQSRCRFCLSLLHINYCVLRLRLRFEASQLVSSAGSQ